MDLRDRVVAMLANVDLPYEPAPDADLPVGGYSVYRGEAIDDDDRPGWLVEHHAAVEGGRKWEAIWRALRR